jgi:hypothetical protein
VNEAGHHTHSEGEPHCIHTAWVVGFEQGEREMHAKCIEAVEQLLRKPGASGEHYLTALRDLQEKS